MQMKFLSLVSTGALFGALGMAPQAALAAFTDSCPGLTGQERTSAVLSDVQLGAGANGTHVYNFKVCNTSGGGEGEMQYLLRDWELPYDPQGGITNFVTPVGWNWAIETIGVANNQTGWDGQEPTWKDPDDLFHDPRYQNLDQVIHFYTCDSMSCYGEGAWAPALTPGEELAGFGFESPFGPTNAPYQASWFWLPPRSGDPAFPLAGADTPGLVDVSAVPEPGGLALFAAALGAMMAARVRRRETSED